MRLLENGLVVFFVKGGFIMSNQTIDFLFLSEEDMIQAGVKDMPA